MDLSDFSRFLAATHTSRVNCDQMGGDRPRQSANKNCYAVAQELVPYRPSLGRKLTRAVVHRPMGHWGGQFFGRTLNLA